jgi:NADPH:quinone reductase-like Zn-dependent oxidoreductase
MKAIILEALNQPLVIKEVERSALLENEALVKIKAAALNHRDVWIQKGQYANIKFPAVLGSDGAGIVTELGQNADKSLLGKEVIINPSHNWGENVKAQSKNFKILGLPDWGTFAEYVNVPAKYITLKPAHLNFEQACAIPLGGLTAYRAMFTRGQLQNGEKVLITGIGGGVALLALQFAIVAGAQVWVTSGSGHKIEKAIALGAVEGVNYKESGWEEKLREQSGGFDLIIDSAAGEDFNKLINLAVAGGRIVFYGGTQGVIKHIPPQKVFWKQLSILGSTMGSESEFKAMVQFVENNKIKPIIDKVFPWQQTEQAMRRMDNSEQFGKIVLQID